jgi:glycolate oxidase iron-sulfur subunit
MTATSYQQDLAKCVRCGTCKTLCPTYLITRNESMSARGRVAMLGEVYGDRLSHTRRLADKIFSCMLCGACKGLCPTGINIPEAMYQGRAALRKSYKKGRFLGKALKLSVLRPDITFPILRIIQKLLYQPLQGAAGLRYIPPVTSRPFNRTVQVYKNRKKRGRVAIFAGCSINYFYPNLGNALLRVLLTRGYEVVVFKGEVCCGAPLRSLGLEPETAKLARQNIEHFNRVRAEAIISMCPTCTMVIKDQYPVLTGDTISNIVDINEFMLQHDLSSGLETEPCTVTYHDPCHLTYGLQIKKEPRDILRSIKGVEVSEMKHSEECCGFAGLFSMHFRDISKTIGSNKIENIRNSLADTVVTSCPGCVMQLERLKREEDAKISVRHIIEIIDEAMHGQTDSSR